MTLVLNLVGTPAFAAVGDNGVVNDESALRGAEKAAAGLEVYFTLENGQSVRVINNCDTILVHGLKPLLAKRVAKVLIPLIYEEVVRALFYVGTVPEANRGADEATVRFSKDSTEELKINLARLRQMKKIFLAETGNSLELVDVVLAQRQGKIYTQLYTVIAKMITYTPHESGLLNREFVLLAEIVDEAISLNENLAAVAANKRMSDARATAKKEEILANVSQQYRTIAKLHEELWRHGLHMTSIENAPPMLLATVALFYGQPGVGALANLKIKK